MSSDISNLILVLSVVLTIAGMVAGVFFLLSMQRALILCAPQNRTLSPGKVWLCFIPLFNIIWMFIVISRVSRSLQREFESRQGPPGDYGRSIGLAYCILAVISIIPIVGMLTGLASIVCWIVYWVKISNYSRILRDGGGVPQDDAEIEEPFDPGKAWLVLLVLMFADAGQHLQTLGLSWFIPALRDSLGISSKGYRPDVHGVYGRVDGRVPSDAPGHDVVRNPLGTGGCTGRSLARIGGKRHGLRFERHHRCSRLVGIFRRGHLAGRNSISSRELPRIAAPPGDWPFFASSPLVAPSRRRWSRISPSGPSPGGQPSCISGISTAIAAVLCWVVLRPPARNAASRGVSGLGIVSVVMLGVGMLFAAPLYAFAQSWLPMIVMRSMGATLATLSTANTSRNGGWPHPGGESRLGQ